MARSSKGRYFQTGARPGPVPAQPTHGATVGPRCWQRQLRLTCDLAGWLAVILFVTIFGIRTVSGAVLGGLALVLLPYASSQLPWWGIGLAGILAGVGIALMANVPDGILGIPWLTEHVRIPGIAGPSRRTEELADVQ